MPNISDKTKEEIKARIINLVNDGMKDKHEIFTKLVEEFNIPRPQIRQIARELRIEYEGMVKVLQSDFV